VISHKFGFLFVHVPKTAGQSIERFFMARHGLTWKERSQLLIRSNPDPACGPEELAHMTAREYRDLGYLAGEAFSRYFKFAFVRNPWDRIVSEYKFRKEYYEHFSFRKFVLERLPQRDPYSDYYRHITPQCEFLFDQGGALIVDFVGRFENLQNDFNQVCARLGIRNSLLPHANSSGTKHGKLKKRLKRSLLERKTPLTRHYTRYYDTELVGLVGKMYEADISAFGYRFGE
jgi:hypothetical protein